jgi:hypothetical protein
MSPRSTVADAIVASKTAPLNGRSGVVVVVEVLVVVDVVDELEDVVVEVARGRLVVVVVAFVVGVCTVTGSAVELGAFESDVAAVELDPLVEVANATTAMPTTPTITTRLAMTPILAGLQPRTTAQGPFGPIGPAEGDGGFASGRTRAQIARAPWVQRRSWYSVEILAVSQRP